MSWSARVTLNDSEGAVGVRSASRCLLFHACEVSLRHFWTRGVMSSARQSLRRCETMSAALPRLPPLVGVRRMMASKARNHFKALASSSSVPELAASSMRDSTSTCAFAYPAMQACGTSKSMAQGFTAHSRTVRLSMACQPMRESLWAVLGSGGSGCSSWYLSWRCRRASCSLLTRLTRVASSCAA